MPSLITCCAPSGIWMSIFMNFQLSLLRYFLFLNCSPYCEQFPYAYPPANQELPTISHEKRECNTFLTLSTNKVSGLDRNHEVLLKNACSSSNQTFLMTLDPLWMEECTSSTQS